MRVDQETTKAKGLEIQAENGFIHAHMPGIQSFQWVKFCPNNIQGQEERQLKMRRWRSTLGIGRHIVVPHSWTGLETVDVITMGESATIFLCIDSLLHEQSRCHCGDFVCAVYETMARKGGDLVDWDGHYL